MSIEQKALRNDIESYLRGELPSLGELEKAPRLDNWSTVITRTSGGGYRMLLDGRVTAHPMLPDGKECTTYEVVWLDRRGRFARLKDRLWRLGEPAAEGGE